MNSPPIYKWLLNKKLRDWKLHYDLLVSFTVAEIGMRRETEEIFRKKVNNLDEEISRSELWMLGFKIHLKIENEIKRANIMRKNIDNLEERDTAVRRSRQRSRRAIQLARKKFRKKVNGAD